MPSRATFYCVFRVHKYTCIHKFKEEFTSFPPGHQLHALWAAEELLVNQAALDQSPNQTIVLEPSLIFLLVSILSWLSVPGFLKAKLFLLKLCHILIVFNILMTQACNCGLPSQILEVLDCDAYQLRFRVHSKGGQMDTFCDTKTTESSQGASCVWELHCVLQLSLFKGQNRYDEDHRSLITYKRETENT